MHPVGAKDQVPQYTAELPAPLGAKRPEAERDLLFLNRA